MTNFDDDNEYHLLLNMRLHETKVVSEVGGERTIVMRVATGWIYQTGSVAFSGAVTIHTQIFVPDTRP